MTEIDFNYFKTKLEGLENITELLVEQISETSEIVELDQNRVGRLSRMDAIQGQAMAKANTKRQIKLLLEIKNALKRIDSSDYGRCLECDELIAVARLEIDPVVQNCIDCAKLAETRNN